jgi:hypothetical protein
LLLQHCVLFICFEVLCCVIYTVLSIPGTSAGLCERCLRRV